MHETINSEGQEVKGQGHTRHERLAEVSFSTHLGRVAFPVLYCFLTLTLTHQNIQHEFNQLDIRMISYQLHNG